MTALTIQNVSIAFGGVAALDQVSFGVEPGEVAAIVGPNGAGKTTLLDIICGLVRADSGRIVVGVEDVTALPAHQIARCGVARTFATLQMFFGMSVMDNIAAGFHSRERRNVLSDIVLPQREWTSGHDYAVELLMRAGLADFAEHRPAALPYGILKRVEILRAVVAEPNVLLLDEPTAGCNPVEAAEVSSLIQKIAVPGMAILMTSRDPSFVPPFAISVRVLDRGCIVAEGALADIRRNEAVAAAYLGTRGSREALLAGR